MTSNFIKKIQIRNNIMNSEKILVAQFYQSEEKKKAQQCRLKVIILSSIKKNLIEYKSSFEIGMKEKQFFFLVSKTFLYQMHQHSSLAT